jgi:pyruvate-formate lyase-activating enzyme
VNQPLDESWWASKEELVDLIENGLWRDSTDGSKKKVAISDWIVFSGGECLYKYFHEVEELNQLAKYKGFKTKVFTNGMFPDRLKKLLPSIDEVSLDIKCGQDDPNYLGLPPDSQYTKHISNALKILKETRFEIRTVVVKPFIDFFQLEKILELLRGHNPYRWIITPVQFPEGGLNDISLNAGQNSYFSHEISDMVAKLKVDFPIEVHH